MTTMISSLPSDLVMEILSRVPLNSLSEVQLTCKKWNVLSKTQSLKKMHIGKALTTAKEGESQMIMLRGDSIYLTSIFVGDGEPSFEHKGKLNEQVKVSEVYHCEGLLLCFWEDDPRFLVWNPYLREKKWIKPRYSRTGDGVDKFHYAFGYEDKKGKYCLSCCVKLLRFIDYYDCAPEYLFFWYEMYDFESGLWTTLDVTPHWRIDPCNYGVSLKGNTYWCATERNLDEDDDDDTADSIICFDFTKERFKQLLPLPFIDGLNHSMVLSCVREEKLAVLVNHYVSEPHECVIWISTKVDAEDLSWSKFLTLPRGPNIMSAPKLGLSFFIDEEKKIAMGCDGSHHFNIIGDAGYFKLLKLFGDIGVYVPSLLQIEQPTGGGQRKQQSELEMHRYDENMSRLVQVEANYHHRYRAEENTNYDGYWMRHIPAEKNQ